MNITNFNITNFDVHGITQAECMGMGMGMGVRAPYVPELSDEVQMVCECTLASSTKLQSPRRERPYKSTSPWKSKSHSQLRASSSSRSLFDLYHPTAKSVDAANEMALQMEDENMDDLEEMERPRTKFRSCSVSSADDTDADVTDTDVTDADTSDASDAEASGVSRTRSSSDTHMAEAHRHHGHLHCLLSPRAMQQCAGEFKLEGCEGTEGTERREGGWGREGSGQYLTEFEPSRSEPRFESRLPVDDSYPLEPNCPFSDASYDVEELFDIFACLVD